MNRYWINTEDSCYIVEYDRTIDGFAVFDAVASGSVATREDWVELQITADLKSELFVAARTLQRINFFVPETISQTQNLIDSTQSYNKLQLFSTGIETASKFFGEYVGGLIIGAGNPAAALLTLTPDDWLELGQELIGTAIEQVTFYEGVALAEQAVELLMSFQSPESVLSSARTRSASPSA